MNARLTRAPIRVRTGGIAPLILSVGSLLLGACRSTRPAAPLPPAYPVAPTPISTEPARAPGWVGEPLSWAQLREIETWLATQGPSADPFWKVEGELMLNQGRVDLSRAEKTGQTAPDSAMRARLRTARAGFKRVLAESEATPGQRKRAEAWVARCDKLLGTSAPSGTEPRLAMSVIPRTQWGAMPAHFQHMDKNRGGWRRITVHHSAEREPPALDGTLAESSAAVRSIQKAHMEGKETGYGDIGYHFVIDPYGRVFQGRDLVWQGAHAAGDNNIQNIGVCLIGNFDEERPTQAALDALRRLLDNLRSSWKISKSQVLTHQELKKTECPGRNLARWVEAYRRSGPATPAAQAQLQVQ